GVIFVVSERESGDLATRFFAPFTWLASGHYIPHAAASLNLALCMTAAQHARQRSQSLRGVRSRSSLAVSRIPRVHKHSRIDSLGQPLPQRRSRVFTAPIDRR